MSNPPATSPFSKTNFVVYGNHQKRGAHIGIRTSDGKVLINFNDGTSTAMIKSVADAIKAEIIVVKGVWTFEPDTEQDWNKEETEDESDE